MAKLGKNENGRVLNDKKILAQYHVGQRDCHCPLVEKGNKYLSCVYWTIGVVNSSSLGVSNWTLFSSYNSIIIVTFCGCVAKIVVSVMLAEYHLLYAFRLLMKKYSKFRACHCQ
jgi:hypothetical protein